jgi:exopolysaccharide biosynthesis operon protein EpsL
MRIGPGRGLVAAAALLAGALAPLAPAHALLGDRLEVFVAETLTYESNLFRISKDACAFCLIGNDNRSDFYLTTSAGVNVDVPISRQRFIGGFAINDVRYDRFSELGYTGHDGRAIWLWEAGNALSGQVGGTVNKSLASFVNFTARVRDIVNTTTVFANASYLVNPSWRLRAGVDQLHQEHSEISRQEQAVDVTGAEGSITYISRAGNSLGVLARNDEGRYPHRQVVATSILDNRYSQRSVSAVLDWAITPASRVSGRIGRVKREFAQLSQRDFSGTIWRAVYDWTPRARFSLSAVAQRDISVIEDVRTSFVLATGFGVRPAYRYSDKLKIEGVLDTTKREYLGDPAVSLGAVPQRDDRINTIGVSATWLPSRSTSVIASVLRESRSSSVQFSDYEAWIVFLRGRISF